MDPRTTVADAPTRDSGAVEADQVVFTSAPSRMAQGYRIVAASRGVLPDEKAEILRRAPSHGSLCVAGQSQMQALFDPEDVALPCQRVPEKVEVALQVDRLEQLLLLGGRQ